MWIDMTDDELTGTAASLRSWADGLQAVVGDVHATCSSCCAPTDVERYLAELVSGVKADVNDVVCGFGVDATDLNTRAGVIGADASLASASSAAWGGGDATDLTSTWMTDMDARNVTTGSSTIGWFNGMAVDDSGSPLSILPTSAEAAAMQPGLDRMTNVIFGLALPGFGASTYSGGTGNAVAALAPILAGSYNATHSLGEPSYSSAVSDGYIGSRDQFAYEHGYDFNDPGAASNA